MRFPSPFRETCRQNVGALNSALFDVAELYVLVFRGKRPPSEVSVDRAKKVQTHAGGSVDQTGVSASSMPFEVTRFLTSGGTHRRTFQFPRGARVYAQGDPCDRLFYIQDGAVKLSVVSSAGKEAVVAILGPGDFLGEGCLTGQTVQMSSATAVTPVAGLVIGKKKMLRLLHDEPAMAEFFLTYVLTRNAHSEEALVDQLCNSSEKRLARTLLLLARFAREDKGVRVIPKLSQEVLAEMVGTTRSRVNFFMNKFRKLGFIEYNGGLKIHDSLFSVILHD
jgi:CRP-like cAMP-binding protein